MYGEGRNWRYLIGFGLLIILLFVVIFMIVRSGGDNKGKVPETQRALVSYANDPDVTVSQTIIGPVTAGQEHHEATIAISNRSANFQLFQGYDGNVIGNREYQMTPTSFGEFLNALDKAGFTQGSTDAELKNDAGYCPQGQRYIFEIKDGGRSVQRFWATSCNGDKSYRGNLNLTLSLFESQIPDYDELIGNANFNYSTLRL